MKKTLTTLSLLALVLTGCTSGTEQSGGDSNPDSQVEQPPLPGQTEPRPQGVDPSAAPRRLPPVRARTRGRRRRVPRWPAGPSAAGRRRGR